ncbi:MAG: N-acetylmuramoyl-L-alanine amidase family protein [Candidatus Saccharibacteria bacterium]
MIRVNYSNILLVVFLSILLSVHSFSNAANSAKQFVVVIDPGHGGKDPGAVNKNVREKDVVLGIGLKLGKLINDNHSDVKVIFTRSTDVFIPLIERSNIANKNKADLFISIHANFCSTPSTRGTETYALGLHRTKDNLDVAKKENSVILLEQGYKTTYEGFDPNLSESYIMFELVQDEFLNQSLSFADAVQQQFKTHISTDNRGVKQAGFLVLRQSSMPSVLIESGFISNPAEANFLNSEEGQQQVAASVFEAFKKFKGRNSGSHIGISTPEIASSKKNRDTNVVEHAGIKNAEISNTKKTKDTNTVEHVVINKEVLAARKNNTDTNITIKQPDTIQPKKTEKEKEEVVLASLETKKTEAGKEVMELKGDATKETNTIKTDTIAKVKVNKTYYCIQIAASTTPIKPVSDNFKGLKDIKTDKLDKFYRYYVGSENSLEAIKQQLKQIKQKFPQAFVVSFVDGKRVPLY